MRFLLLPLLFLVTAAGLEDPTAKLAEIDRSALAQKAAIIRIWIRGVDLAPQTVPQPENPGDPRASETAAIEAAHRANRAREDIQKWLAGPEVEDDSRTVAAWGPLSIKNLMVEMGTGVARAAATAVAPKGHKPPSGGIKSHPGE